jgi:hypothetical protein
MRTRTPSETKWLTNELAMLAGEIASIDSALARLRLRRRRLQAARRALSQVATQLSAADLGRETAPVRAHSPYGGRGQLRTLLEDLLRSALPDALDTKTLTAVIAGRIGLAQASRTEMETFRRNQIARALRHLQRDGLVERLHDLKLTPTQVGVWRWTGGAVPLPTLAELGEKGAG